MADLVSWRISESIALELDTALGGLNGYYAPASLPAYLAPLVEAAADDWQATWSGMLAEPGRAQDLLEVAAGLAGTLLEEDYSRATLPIRELTVEAALARMAGPGEAGERAGEAGSSAAPRTQGGATSPRSQGRGTSRLVELALRRRALLYEGVGLPEPGIAQELRRYEADLGRVLRLLQGGDLHARFWHWLDRFYYEHYGPWRRSRAEEMARAEQRLRVALGDAGRSSSVELAWLPPQHPLLRLVELREAVEAGRLNVVWWIEPFGLADAWTLQEPPGRAGPPLLVTSCAEPGQLFENFRAAAAGVAARAHALADPTRLIILRVIRHFGMVNTEMAEYLGLARPTVSIHAKILREAGLIRSRQEGRLVRHELAPEEVRRLFDDLERFLDLPEREE